MQGPNVGSKESGLGRLLNTYAMAPAVLQRAAVVAIVSFTFFLLTLIALYIRQHIGYLALSSAFLAVYIFTFVSWVLQRRNVVRIYSNGIRYKSFSASWPEVRSVNASKKGLQIKKNGRETALIPPTISGYHQIVVSVKTALESGGVQS